MPPQAAFARERKMTVRGGGKNWKCIIDRWQEDTTHGKIALTGGISYMKATGIVRRIDD